MKRRGQALVEFALVLPVLVLLLVAIISLGLTFNAELTLTQAARAAARAAALGYPLGQPGDVNPPASGCATIYGAADVVIVEGLGLTMADLSIPAAYVEGSTAGGSPVPPDAQVTVVLQYAYRPLLPIPGVLPASLLLSQTYTMMAQDPVPVSQNPPPEPLPPGAQPIAVHCPDN
ncbi:conserved protein of unknown function [Candidatus Hydrogenisulfobacillus filiaventi]|uniref:TadE-like domain-containing protein n=1 Tax=Candidatus Hydrogenisulfobacillus filiaventi TaxID=2707344 RepID=A0A6F8ZDQ2_9FIRM|nr:pilus assembly protein [Bacillota bacterium]CAB1127885.1 conserved protein of unknown function [Candidatus Hydrogenisulfobacillus filiaventi]